MTMTGRRAVLLVLLYSGLAYTKLFLYTNKAIDLVVYAPLLLINMLLYYLIISGAMQLYRKNKVDPVNSKEFN